MSVKIVCIVICALCLPVSALALESSPVTVTEMVFCSGIKDRNPIDVDTNFPDSIERVFCYTKVSSTRTPTFISHVWYYNDTQMAIVDLPVKASPWRTWSSKCIVREWTGVWRVDVISSTGNIICSEQFVISSSEP